MRQARDSASSWRRCARRPAARYASANAPATRKRLLPKREDRRREKRYDISRAAMPVALAPADEGAGAHARPRVHICHCASSSSARLFSQRRAGFMISRSPEITPFHFHFAFLRRMRAAAILRDMLRAATARIRADLSDRCRPIPSCFALPSCHRQGAAARASVR